MQLWSVKLLLACATSSTKLGSNRSSYCEPRSRKAGAMGAWAAFRR